MNPITEAIRRFAGTDEHVTVRKLRANWKGAVLAESDRTVVVEGNHYFPPEDVNVDYLKPSASHTRCFWKGVASYYDVVVEGERNADAAWYYSQPSRAASNIKDHVAFRYGVKIGRAPAE